jgi:hypothetical protein
MTTITAPSNAHVSFNDAKADAKADANVHNYVILRFKDGLDENELSFDPRSSAKDLIKVKVTEDDRKKTLYLQSAPCTMRSPLIIDGETQKYVDFDLWETSSKQSREFVRKVEAIEAKVVEVLTRTLDTQQEPENAKRILKTSLRILQKAKKASMPAFRLSTEAFNNEGIFNATGRDLSELEDARVQFIAELSGVKVAKRNGLAVCVWKLSQLRILPDQVSKDTIDGDRIDSVVNNFDEDVE